MVNFGLLAAEIGWPVRSTPVNFNWFRVLASLGYCTASSSGRQPNFAALNTGRHLYSAGRPSRALAHISSIHICFRYNLDFYAYDSTCVLCLLCRHMCMVMRGVQKLQSKTITSSMLGELRENPKSREEFLSLIHCGWNCRLNGL